MFKELKLKVFTKKMLALLLVTGFMVFSTGAAGEESDGDVNVRINAPEIVSGIFEVTLEIEDVSGLDSGQFDLSFNPDVLNVEEVEAGSIDDTEVPIAMWRIMDDDTIRVTFNLPGADGVSGSGSLTKIIFEVIAP